MKRTIKQITLIKLSKIFIIKIFLITIIIGFGYRSFYQKLLENEAITIASSVKAGLTSHMQANIMDKKQYFLEQVSKIKNVTSIKIINTQKNISTQPQSILNVLKTKKNSFEWHDIDGKFKAIIPYIASSKDSLNCLNCHHAKEGSVLGVVIIQMNINLAQSMVIKYSSILLFILVLLSAITLMNFSKLIKIYISYPLKNIIEEAKEAYHTHSSLNSNDYESRELEEIAENINHFNRDVIEKENVIYKKNIALEKLNEEIESTLRDTMIAMGEIEEIRSKETKNHTLRVSKLSALIAEKYGLSVNEVKLIKLTAPLHDIGKVGIRDDILQKPGRLTQNEFEIMKEHSALGYKVLKHSKREILQTAAKIAHSHHERWNGKGYPQGLKGKEIPLFARIVAIVDVMDALLGTRIYKNAWKVEDVKKLIESERGEHFEEKLADIVLENFDEYVLLINDLSK